MGIAVKFEINTTLVALKIEISLCFASFLLCNTCGIYPKFSVTHAITSTNKT